MKWVLAILLALLAGSAYAQFEPGAKNFGRICPGGGALCSAVPNTPTRYYNLLTGSIPSDFSYTRTGTAWYFNSSGLLASAAANVPRFDYQTPGSSTLAGLLLEAASTNKALYSGDLTQTSAWTATNATVALDQIGIDGTASDASSITATSSSATVCQTITQASTSSVFSVYLKRITGTGTISISQDGGSTSTTTALTSSWQRFAHAAQSTLNPGICIQVATNGDEIGVDMAQFEAIGFVTSPIPTASTTVSRSADVLSVPSSWYNVASGAAVIEWSFGLGNTPVGLAGWGGVFSTFFNWHNNGGNFEVPVDGQHCGSNLAASSVHKSGATYGNAFFDAATDGTLCARSVATNLTKPASLGIGPGNPVNGSGASIWLRKFTYWNYPISGTYLQSQTM